MRYPNIEAERARHGMSMDALAKEIGVTRKSIYNWINKGNIPQAALEKMAAVFDCSVEYLTEIE
jgi:DNA-binding XRE family transcriptional regulator